MLSIAIEVLVTSFCGWGGVELGLVGLSWFCEGFSIIGKMEGDILHGQTNFYVLKKVKNR